MNKRRIGVLVLLLALVFCGLAVAGSPTNSQYGNPTENEGGPPSERPHAPTRLPFTGFQAAMVLMAGVGALTAGLMLRGGTAETRGRPRLVLPSRSGPDLDLAFLTAPLEHCEGCGKPLSPMGFRIRSGGRSYHSVECARAPAHAARSDFAFSFTA
jgi:hypothetical protein